jgi:hypothetical protein
MTRGAAAIGLFVLLLIGSPFLIIAAAETSKDIHQGATNSLWLGGLALIGILCWAVTRKGGEEKGPALGEKGNAIYAGPKFWAWRPATIQEEEPSQPATTTRRWTHLSGWVEEPATEEEGPVYVTSEDPKRALRYYPETRRARLDRYRRHTR